MNLTILYIEDDTEIGSWVTTFLQEQGYTVYWKTSGHEAFEAAKQADLVILDIMLPGLDGYSIGLRLKKTIPQIPILLLTARTSIEDKLQGLAFADDYLTKPFHPDELAARLQVLLKRSGAISSDHIQLRHLSIDRQANLIIDTRSGSEIVLTGKQFHIFMYLLRHPNQVLTKKQLFEAVWGELYIEGDKTLMVHIRHLREKIEIEPSSPGIIETIRGIGYRIRQ
jgi:Response regulators consisting of a CheY-like receiver domain and a winged-helix DNA-binding domain